MNLAETKDLDEFVFVFLSAQAESLAAGGTTPTRSPAPAQALRPSGLREAGEKTACGSKVMRLVIHHGER